MKLLRTETWIQRLLQSKSLILFKKKCTKFRSVLQVIQISICNKNCLSNVYTDLQLWANDTHINIRINNALTWIRPWTILQDSIKPGPNFKNNIFSRNFLFTELNVNYFEVYTHSSQCLLSIVLLVLCSTRLKNENRKKMCYRVHYFNYITCSNAELSSLWSGPQRRWTIKKHNSRTSK